MQETRNCVSCRKRNMTFRLAEIDKHECHNKTATCTCAYLFSFDAGSCYVFRLEATVVSFLHLMDRVNINHTSKREFVAILCCKSKYLLNFRGKIIMFSTVITLIKHKRKLKFRILRKIYVYAYI